MESVHPLCNTRTRRARGTKSGPKARGEGTEPGEEISDTTKSASKRPSLSEPLVKVMIQDIPQGTGLETPLHPKRRRVLPTTVTNVSLSEWDPSELKQEYTVVCEAGSESQQIEDSKLMSATKELSPLPLEMVLEAPSPVVKCTVLDTMSAPVLSVLVLPEVSPVSSVVSTVESPLSILEAPSPGYVECGGSVASTRKASRGNKRAAKRTLSTSTSRPQQGTDNLEHLFYGSDESETEIEEEEGIMPVMMPRSIRSFLQDEAEVEEPTEIVFMWPLEPSSSTSESAAPSLPIKQPESGQPESGQPESGQSESGQQTSEQLESHFEPASKFDFKWRAFPQPQIEPNLRREPFSQINCGPTATYACPYDAFIAIWDRQIVEYMVAETNRYAQQLATIMIKMGTMCPNSRITQWHDTDVDELYTYFAIMIATGVVVKSRIEEYWNSSEDIFSTPQFKVAMKLDRFLLLNRCLHFRNNEKCKPTLLTRPQARLFKVQPIIDHLNLKFSQLYVMDQNIALDESLTMWKGWLDINQFIRNKKAEVGIKTYEVCESRTGYLWRFVVHTGHDESTRCVDGPVSGIIPSLVLNLIKGLENRGHTLWMDNFYNSPALARELKSRGFDCVGTLRTNRQFVPIELTQLKKTDMAVGQVYGCTSGDVDLMVWRDKNQVALISTYHGLATVNCGDKPKPTVIADYNICMGGVDRKDQMLAMFPMERKRMLIWYKKLFRRLLNVSILNAYILFKANQSITHRYFRKTLVSELLARHSTFRPRPHTHSDNTQGFKHFPAQYTITEANKANRYRRNCAECGKRVTCFCKGCDKPLCVFTCFEPYHTKLLKSTAQ